MSSVHHPTNDDDDDKSMVSSLAPKVMSSSEHDVVVCGVIGPTALPKSCPCCNRRVGGQVEGRQTLDEPARRRRQDRVIPCLFEQEDEEQEEEDDCQPGVLDSGVEYKFKRILAEGWVNKKGSGKDWFGSRAFKPRWAKLVVSGMLVCVVYIIDDCVSETILPITHTTIYNTRHSWLKCKALETWMFLYSRFSGTALRRNRRLSFCSIPP